MASRELILKTDLVSFYGSDHVEMLKEMIKDSAEFYDDANVKKVDMTEFLKKLAYVGFDPLVMNRLLVERWRNKQEPKSDVKSWSFGGLTIDMATPFPSVMYFLIVIFMTRGSNLKKLKDKSDKDLKEVMIWLTTVFSMHERTRGQGKSMHREAVSLPRIAACYPFHGWYFLMKSPDSFQPPVPVRPYDFITSNIPKVLRHPLSQSCVPSAEDSNHDIRPLLLVVAKKLDEFLNPSAPTKLVQIAGYCNNARTSKVLGPKSRKLLCKEAGLGTSHQTSGIFEWSDEVIKLIKECKANLTSLERSDDFSVSIRC